MRYIPPLLAAHTIQGTHAANYKKRGPVRHTLQRNPINRPTSSGTSSSSFPPSPSSSSGSCGRLEPLEKNLRPNPFEEAAAGEPSVLRCPGGIDNPRALGDSPLTLVVAAPTPTPAPARGDQPALGERQALVGDLGGLPAEPMMPIEDKVFESRDMGDTPFTTGSSSPPSIPASSKSLSSSKAPACSASPPATLRSAWPEEMRRLGLALALALAAAAAGVQAGAGVEEAALADVAKRGRGGDGIVGDLLLARAAGGAGVGASWVDRERRPGDCLGDKVADVAGPLRRR